MQELLHCPFVGVHELRQRLPAILAAVREEGQDIVITHQGKPVAVLVDVEKYLEWQEAILDAFDPEFLPRLLESQKEMQEGKVVPADEVFRRLGL